MTVAADATSDQLQQAGCSSVGYELVLRAASFKNHAGDRRSLYAAARKVKAPATTKAIKFNWYSEGRGC